MKKFSLLFFFFIYFFAAVVNSQDSCGSSLNIQLPFAFNATALRCISAWGSQGFILRYQQVSNDVWNFILSAPNKNAYIAIGFSPNGRMVGSHAIVGWVADGTGNANRYYLGGTSSSSVTVASDNSGNFVISQLSLIPNSNQLYMTFQLTGQPTTQLIYAVGPTGALPRSPNYRLAEHTDFARGNLRSGQTETETTASGDILLKAHGLTTMLGWAILLPLGIMAARYMKIWDPLWFNTHVTMQLAGFSLGIGGIVTGFILEDQTDAEVDIHKVIGIVILVLGCLQATALLIRPAKLSKVRKYWNWYHFSAGRSVVILGIANVFYGIHLAHAGLAWNAGFGASLAVLVCVSLVLELRMWFRS